MIMDFDAIRNVPVGITAEDFLLFFSDAAPKVIFDGPHLRNAYNDIGIPKVSESPHRLHIHRKSLYDSLPEYMFHPIGRFQHVVDENEFQDECSAQEKEIENARKFFLPVDLLLLKSRMEMKRRLDVFSDSNTVLENIIGDTLTDSQKNNILIKKTMRFLPQCRTIRGDRTKITLMLRKVLGEENLYLEEKIREKHMHDDKPEYGFTVGDELGRLYAGNDYIDPVFEYKISFWKADKCDGNFQNFVDDLEGFRVFVQDYFLGVGDNLVFDLVCDSYQILLSDEVIFNYLDYNTNL